MAKKNNNKEAIAGKSSQPASPVPTSLPAGRGSMSSYMQAAIAVGVAVIAWFVLKVCLDNQFTDWDDAGYIINNPIVKDISSEGLKNIFVEPVMGNYHPITILSYALEYSKVELEPWLYHFDSLGLHLLVTVLVWWFVHVLTNKPIAATVTALLFSIHPMHVESVAWVAGRKDLLCALFYFAACIAYTYSLRAAGSKKWYWYASVILLFLCSLLSKPVSVTLPLILLLIDYFEKREWKSGLLTEKIPFFILSLIFGIISVKIQHGGGAMDVQKVPFNFFERLALGSYALVTYLLKAIIPAHLCCFYPYPAKVNGSLPFLYYLNILVIVAVLYAVWKYAKTIRVVVFGMLFFMVNIALLLQFIPVGDAIVAERYSYIPYLGLFFVAGWYVSEWLQKGVGERLRYAVLSFVLLCMICFSYLSAERCKVWYNAATLWRDEIEKEPMRAAIAYNNLGYYYFNRKSAATDPVERRMAADSALYLMQKAIELKPDFVNAYQGLGMLYFMKGDFESSISSFRMALHISPTAENHSDYANLLLQTGKADSALIEYNTAVSLNPGLFIARLNRGKLFKSQNRCDEAIADLDKAVSLNPASSEVYYIRSFCYVQKGNKALALQDVEKAISLGYPQVDNNYYQGLKN